MNPKQLLFIIILWLSIIGGLFVTKEWVYQTGRTVTIEVEPIDPTDLFRGSYVILNYKISRLPISIAAPLTLDDLRTGSTLYVIVTQQDSTLVPERVTLKKPTAETLFLKGTLMSHSPEGELHVEYGIESYFASAEKAREFETFGRTGKLEAVVAVDDRGTAVLQDLKMK